jgi:hypothetical protein
MYSSEHSKKIVEILEAHGKTLPQMAKLLGTSTSFLADVKAGKNCLNSKHMKSLEIKDHELAAQVSFAALGQVFKDIADLGGKFASEKIGAGKAVAKKQVSKLATIVTHYAHQLKEHLEKDE